MSMRPGSRGPTDREQRYSTLEQLDTGGIGQAVFRQFFQTCITRLGSFGR